jgi:uncharacterized membrane protein
MPAASLLSMSGPAIGFGLSVFLACAVEAVEALTIVLAVGSTRSWRSALTGVAAALMTLALIVAALGPALTSLPIDLLSAAVGCVLLVFGLQWLRKAVLRAAGLKALHDEREIYGAQVAAARATGVTDTAFDRYSFTIAFQGVFVEGFEIVVIVLGFSASRHNIGLAAVSAGLAVVAVALAGIVARAPLTRVPENAMKLLVGAMLTSFGLFWGGRGLGVHWPGGDAALLAIVACVLLASLAVAWMLRVGVLPGRVAVPGSADEG